MGGACYFLTCYDDYSRKIHLSFLKQKSDPFSAIKAYIALVERQLGTKVKTLRIYLIDTGLPQSFWAECVSYTAYTRNRTPCGPQSAIPDNKWFGKSKQHTAYFRDHRHISKLSPRYRKGLLLGYQEGTHNYQIWNGNKVIITRDAVFVGYRGVHKTSI
jgi:hypothetical protein